MFFVYSVYKGVLYSDKPFSILQEAKDYADSRQKRATEKGLSDYFVVMQGRVIVYSTKPSVSLPTPETSPNNPI